MNSELIIVLVGFTVVYAWTVFLCYGHIRLFQKENRELRAALSRAMHSLSVYNAAKEGDLDTARIMVAVKRDDEKPKTKPPSAGAKESKATGIVITEGLM